MNEDREINLISLFFHILKEWRKILAALIVGILLGLCIGIYKYATLDAGSSDMQAADAKATDILTESEETESEKEEDELDADKVAVVHDAVKYAREYYEYTEYLDKSVIAGIDSNNAAYSEAVLIIKAANENNILPLKELYKAILLGSECKDYVLTSEGYDISESDIVTLADESSSNYYSTDGIFKITVTYNNKDSAEKIIKAMLAYAEAKKTEIEKIVGSHEINTLHTGTTVYRDKNILSSQSSMVRTAADYRNQSINARNALSIKQLEYYIELLKKESWDTTEYQDIAEKLLEERIEEREAALLAAKEAKEQELAAAENDKDAEAVNEAVEKPNVNIFRYVFAGGMAGLFVYVCFVAFMYIMRDRVDNADDLSNIYGIQELGHIPAKDIALKSLPDKWIYSLATKNKNSFDGSVDMICAEVENLILKNNISSLAIAIPGNDFADNNLPQLLAEKALQFSKNIHILDGVLCNSENLNSLSASDGVLILCMADKTKRTDVSKLITLINRHEISMLGGVIAESW